MTKETPIKWRIDFFAGGSLVCVWQYYYSRAEALRAIHDADLMIPTHWTYEIEYEEAA